jgi:hypothetical protein
LQRRLKTNHAICPIINRAPLLNKAAFARSVAEIRFESAI